MANNTIKTYHDDGSIFEESQVNDKNKRHGPSQIYHENGQLLVEVNWTNGKQDPGTVISYHNNGVKAREVVLSENGVFKGDFIEWHENGNIKTKGFYNKGVCTIEKEFYENGFTKENVFFGKLLEEKEIKVNWLQDIWPIYPFDAYVPHVLLHNPVTKNDCEYICLFCNNKTEAIDIIDYIISLNGGIDKFLKHEQEKNMSHRFSGHLFNIGYRNELSQQKHVIVELNRREERKVVSFNDKSEILYGIHQDSKKVNSMIDGLNSIVYNSGETTSGGGHLYYTSSGSHIVSYWSELDKVIEKFKTIVDNYPENAIIKNYMGLNEEIKDSSFDNLINATNNSDFVIELKTSNFSIDLSKGTSSYQMNIYFNKD